MGEPHPLEKARQQLEPATTDHLMKVMLNKNEHYLMRFTALKLLLQRKDSKADKFVADVIGAEDTLPELRDEAIRQAGEQHSSSDEVIDALVHALRDKTRRIRHDAAEALGEIGDPSAVEPLSTILTSDEADIKMKQAAVRALGQLTALTALHPLLVEILANALQDKSEKDTRVRKAAAQALGRIPHYLSRQILTDTAQDENEDEPEDVKWEAISALSSMASKATSMNPERKSFASSSAFLVDLPMNPDDVERKERLGRYRRYLKSIRERLPEGAREYAFGPHHDCGAAVFCNDSWLKEIRLETLPADGNVQEQYKNLYVRFHVYHPPDRYNSVELQYKKVRDYRLDASETWRFDEVRSVEHGYVVHEIRFVFEGYWLIECEDFTVEWKPLYE